MIGEGYRKIPSYKCNLPFDELNKKRIIFWKSRKKNRELWKVLNDCCESDQETIEILLNAAMLSCEGENLRRVIFEPMPDVIFRIPNYCIWDPVYERDYEQIKNKYQNISEKQIKIVIFDYKKNEKQNLDVRNRETILELKKKFCELVNLEFEKYNIRFFSGGFELLNDNLICYDNVTQNENRILASIYEI